MCRSTSISPVVWCALLLVVTYAAENPGDSTREDEDDTVWYEPYVNFTSTWDRDENGTRDDEQDSVQYEPHVNFTSTWDSDGNGTRDDEEDSVQYEPHVNFTSTWDSDGNGTRDNEEDYSMQYEPHANFTSAWNRNGTRDDEEDSVQHEFHSNYTSTENGDRSAKLREDNSTRTKDLDGSLRLNNVKKTCNDTACVPICCEPGYRMVHDICVADNVDYPFPQVNEMGEKVVDAFQLFVSDPCTNGRYLLNTDLYSEDEYVILSNGTVYQPQRQIFIEKTSYCFAVLKKKHYELTICFEKSSPSVSDELEFTGVPIGILVSLPFLLLTFLVYTILPELWNMHGYTLRGYVGSMFVAYCTLAPFQLVQPNTLSDFVCIGSAFVIHFSFLASFFWLNVMCFDIWWTFGGFRSLQGSVKQRERKKFIIYSIYAWGCASILTIVCAIMDFVPTVPKTFIKPEFGKVRCWYTTDEAKAVYFYGPMSITVFCNICLFISTALKIIRHKKDTAHHLRGSESRRHDDNKQWFNLYLKLFIVMGINWSMEIISWLFKSAPAYVWYLSDLTNALQGLIIFIIFVWKDKIKRLLLKRFGCQERGLFSRNSTRSGCHSTNSRTCTTSTTGVMPLQEKISPYVQTNCRAKNSSDETDCP